MKLQILSVLTFFALLSCSQQHPETKQEEDGLKTTLLSASKRLTLPQDIVGDYLCTISENAGIASAHTEDSGPPKSFSKNTTLWKFKLRISRDAKDETKYRMIEIPYLGADRNPTDWHTPNSVLHSPYVGNGVEFTALEDQAFVSFHKTIHKNEDGDMSFYHAGFAWAGGEDSFLLARWGRCKLDE